MGPTRRQRISPGEELEEGGWPTDDDTPRVIITKIDNILAKSSSLSEKSAELCELMNREDKAVEALKKTFEATEVAEFLKQLSGKVDGKTEEVMGLLERNCQEIKSLKDQGMETILSIVEQTQTSSAEAALPVVEPGLEKKPFLSVKHFVCVVKILLAKLEEDPEYKETVLYLSYIHQTLDDDDYERFVHRLLNFSSNCLKKVDGKTEEVMGLLERNCQEIKSLKDQGTETIAILKKILSIVEQTQTSSAEAALPVVEPGPEKKLFLSVKHFVRVVKILLAKLEEDPEYKETALYLSYIHQTLDDDDYERFVHSGKRVVTITARNAKSKLHNLKLKMRLKIILVW